MNRLRALCKRLLPDREHHAENLCCGVKASIPFAPLDRITASQAIVDRIVVGALGLPPEDVLLSDESRLSDFALVDEYDEAVLRERIGRLYDVDISHIGDGNIAHIAEHIAQHSPRA